MQRPLEGVKVVELSTFIAGPSCARFLADLGADVTKVESPKGDPLRYTAVNEGRPFGDAEDTSFTMENTGKKCIVLNTKSENGREALEKMIAGCDVFITNIRPNGLKRAHLDYETLSAKYPKLVMGYVSGFGEEGPAKDLPGFDFTAYFARGGVMGTMFDVDSKPLMPVAGFGDHQVGIFLAAGILAALYRARETGKGDQVTVSLFHTAIWDVGLYLSASQYGDPAVQYPVSQRSIANQMQIPHKTSDDKWVMIAVPQYDALFPKFATEVLKRPDMANDPKFYPQTNAQDNLSELYDIIDSTVRSLTLDEMCARMDAADLPYAKCQTWADLLSDEQAWASHALEKVTFPNGKQRSMVRTPVMFANTELPPYERGGFMGEDTESVLAGLGYTPEQIKAMIEAGEAAGCKRIG